jgi:hypothetical protein
MHVVQAVAKKDARSRRSVRRARGAGTEQNASLDDRPAKSVGYGEGEE